MAKPQEYRDVEIPTGFDDWNINARVNYLAGAMDRTQIADYLRDITGQEKRQEPTFKKDELVEIIIKVQE